MKFIKLYKSVCTDLSKVSALLLLYCSSIQVVYAQSGKEKNTNPLSPAIENNANPLQITDPARKHLGTDNYRKISKNYEQQLLTQPKNAAAWQNYYEAERYSYYTKTSNDIKPEQQKKLDNIVMQMEKNVPDSYEYHYIKYLNGNHDVNLFFHLQKAYELNPGYVELYNQFIAYYELTGNIAKKSEFCKKLYNSNEFSPAVMEYAYNMLQSLDKNAILITHGEYDTYPAWILQYLKHTRSDVTILYLDLLEKDSYRKTKLSELGINVNSTPASGKAAFLKEIASKSHQPVYFANTVSPEILKSLTQQLFLTGLAFKYSETPIDNLTTLMHIWESNFKKEWIKKVTNGSSEAQLYNNYLPMMILLKEHYEKINQTNKANEISEIAIKIAAAGGKEHQLKLFLNKQ